MNRFLRLLMPILATMTIASCDKVAELTLSESMLEIPYTGGNHYITLDCNGEWYSSPGDVKIDGKTSSLTPFRVSPSSGSSGETSITIIAERNNFASDISQVFRFSCEGEVYRDLLVIQKANPNAGGQQGESSSLSAPMNLRGTVSGNTVNLSWNSVSSALYYKIYYSNSYSGNYTYLGYVYASQGSSATVDAEPGTFYFKVTAANDEAESGYSNIVAVTVAGSGDTGGSTGGGSGNGGGSTGQAPSAPTSVSVQNYGSVLVPDIRVSWNGVSDATGYSVYRSTSAYGTYSKLGSTSYTYYSDNSCKIGNKYYYKVKAYNNAGNSEYSDYAEFEYKDTRKPGPVVYGNCTVSGTTMTIRWSLPSNSQYGKPTKALLRVKNPYSSSEYATVSELSGTATSASFQYLPWVDSNGYVYVGIILENDYGSGGGTPKVYDNNAKKWIY